MKFQHPTVENGSITHELGQFEIKDGVVECPSEVGRECGMKSLEAVTVNTIKADEAGRLKAAAEQAAADREAAVKSVLEGSVFDIATHVATLKTADDVEFLATLEAKGKNRRGVEDACFDQLEAISQSKE